LAKKQNFFMARRLDNNPKIRGEQLGFDMGMILPKFVPANEKEPSVKVPPAKAGPTISLDQVVVNDEKIDALVETPLVMSVGELTHRITTLLEEVIGMIWVEGEVSNFRRQSSGHTYFTLKDESAQLSCVLFARSAAAQARVELCDGLQVQLYGQISVYQPRGQYQLMVRLVQSKGEGILQARFEELKRRLAAEGLFDQERKRPLPRFPRRIGVVTSPTGAAIQDFLQVLHRRHPGLRVVISPVRVQGKGAADEIAEAISEFSSNSKLIGAVDVIVVTRGGGSLEDLWEFNEEIVARAIVASNIPVVSAVGHEIDFSIADFVADLRAPTPSAAAELLAADSVELLDRCRSFVARIRREAEALLERYRAHEDRLASDGLFREPLRRLDEARQTSDRFEGCLSGILERRIEQLRASLSTASVSIRGYHPRHQLARARDLAITLDSQLKKLAIHRLDRERGRFSRFQSALAALSPEATLARGFSITRDADGSVVTHVSQIQLGEKLITQLFEGEIVSEVKVKSRARS
jgi:exodeoxyribonuclease VII large subunit